MARALTTFGVGSTAESLRTDKDLPSTVATVVEVAVPDGVDGSKFGTWVQRCAIDGGVPPDVPAEVATDISAAAAIVADGSAVALDMTGSTIGAKMAARMGAADGDRIWFVTCLAD
jgi:hypothetical protein